MSLKELRAMSESVMGESRLEEAFRFTANGKAYEGFGKGKLTAHMDGPVVGEIQIGKETVRIRSDWQPDSQTVAELKKANHGKVPQEIEITFHGPNLPMDSPKSVRELEGFLKGEFDLWGDMKAINIGSATIERNFTVTVKK